MTNPRRPVSSSLPPPSWPPLPLMILVVVAAAAATNLSPVAAAFAPPPSIPTTRLATTTRTTTTMARPERAATTTRPLFATEEGKGAPPAAAEVRSDRAGDEGDAGDEDEDDGLTAQERVLRSLGVEPESAEQREARASARAAVAEEARSKKRTNAAVAALAFAAALLNYGWKMTHPVSAVEILAEMQSRSDPLTVIGRNGRPTVVDFWAPWCENCRYSAPTLRSVEREYGDRVNFVMVNGDDPDAWPVIERLGVDAIPHLAMISREGDVETALIGPIPRSVLRADIDALLERERGPQLSSGGGGDGGAEESSAAAAAAVAVADEKEQGSKKPLPYVMYDAFRGRPEMRRVQF